MRISKNETLVLVVDIQERLFGHIENHALLVKNMTILLQGLKHLDIPFIVNEQYKKGLGETIAEIEAIVSDDEHFEKTSFSCLQNLSTKETLLAYKKKYAIVMGVEAHVCVLQTCLDLLEYGIQPILIVDCIGSRKQRDCDVAVQRLAQAGVILATYESILFELCESSREPAFKAISQLVK
ncbi:MAG: isochorismatase family protein [Sulfurospirillaceae bacterium]|nr:isochorismatase family protein [Sulfurospirillaceae bacterium]